MTRLSSAKYLNGARGSNCTIRIANVCQNDVATVISAHLRDKHAGRGQKASDISTASCCFLCHEILDRRAKLPSGEYLSDADWLYYALRGLQETLEQRIEAGLLVFPHDAPKPPKAITRKPAGQRAKIASGPTNWPKRSFQKRGNNETKGSQR